MATVHEVSLFLPYTTSFHKKEEMAANQPLQRAQISHSPFHRAQHSLEVPKRVDSIVSLMQNELRTVAEETAAAVQALQLPITPGRPRSLMRTDAETPEWGKQTNYGQPTSRAVPLPSSSIQDFAKVREQLEKQTRQRSRSRGPARARQVVDKDFEDKIWMVEPALQGNGGLANAMRESTSDYLADITWHGVLGCPTDALPAAIKENIADELANEYQAQVVYVADTDFQGLYTGYCKTILWPHFHYNIPDHPTSRAYLDHSYGFYESVNRSFAENVIASYKKGDNIWVHDYHLLLVPAMIREKLPDAQIGFFLHTPFPSSEVFRCLDKRIELLEGMLGANLVAFQVEEYETHFLQTCSRLLCVEVIDGEDQKHGVQLEDRFVNVTSIPIGINLEAINEQRAETDVQDYIAQISKRYVGKRIIVARDKLDSISGVRHKLASYERFLRWHPEWHGKVVLIQVITSTTYQADHMKSVLKLVSQIEQHGTFEWSPLHMLRQDIPFGHYLTLLSIADVLVVGSQRDGMNLTAHDYIVCQDGKYGGKKHGALILSEFTGCSSLFGDEAIPMNPWDHMMTAAAFNEALLMSEEEKKRRWERMYDIVLNNSGAKWAKSLALTLREVHEEQTAHDAASIPRLSVQQVSTAYESSKLRLFFLDFEGTLAPHRTQKSLAMGLPQRVIDTLTDLLDDPCNHIYIMSGRKPEELDGYFKTMPGLGFIAENGCFVRGSNDTQWFSFTDADAMKQWKSGIDRALDYYLERIEDTYLEERHCSMLIRFEKCKDQAAASRIIGECATHINGAFNSMRVRAVPIKQAILIETMDYNKASAAEHILKQLRAKQGKDRIADFLFVAGDDREDEGIFRWANEFSKQKTFQHVFTVTVGKRNTEAQATLTQGTSGLLNVLNKLARISADQQPMHYFHPKSRHLSIQ